VKQRSTAGFPESGPGKRKRLEHETQWLSRLLIALFELIGSCLLLWRSRVKGKRLQDEGDGRLQIHRRKKQKKPQQDTEKLSQPLLGLYEITRSPLTMLQSFVACEELEDEDERRFEIREAGDKR